MKTIYPVPSCQLLKLYSLNKLRLPYSSIAGYRPTYTLQLIAIDTANHAATLAAIFVNQFTFLIIHARQRLPPIPYHSRHKVCCYHATGPPHDQNCRMLRPRNAYKNSTIAAGPPGSNSAIALFEYISIFNFTHIIFTQHSHLYITLVYHTCISHLYITLVYHTCISQHPHLYIQSFP